MSESPDTTVTMEDLIEDLRSQHVLRLVHDKCSQLYRMTLEGT